MKIYNVEDATNRMISCHKCGYQLLVLQVCKDYLNIMNPNLLSYCPICGTEIYTIENLKEKIMDLEYKIMREEEKECQKQS